MILIIDVWHVFLENNVYYEFRLLKPQGINSNKSRCYDIVVTANGN